MPRLSPLWRHSDFLKLWFGQGISETGSQVTTLALPSVAILILHAGAVQVGILSALSFLAFPALGLIAGVWADRLPRRRLLIACDIVRLLAVASVPLAGVLGHLSMAQLYAVALITGIGTVFFDVTYQSYLPALIDRAQLVDGNSKLQITMSTAQVIGPAIAGLLIQTVRASIAMAADAVSYLVSVLSLLWIRKTEARPEPVEGARTGFLIELWEGMRAMFGNSDIRLIAGCTATSNLATGMNMAVLLLFAYHQLHIAPGSVGLVFAIGGAGAIGGAMVAGSAGRYLGLGRALVGAVVVDAAASVLLPLAAVGPPLVLLGAGLLLRSLAIPVYDVNQVSLRQAIVPLRLQGRLNATVRTVIWGTIPLGSAVGGVLGAHIGYAPTLYLCAVASGAAVIWLLFGPVRLRTIPDSTDSLAPPQRARTCARSCPGGGDRTRP